MPIKPDSRRRLAELMDERRAELRLRWRDVADLGGVSYEVLRAVRHGTGEIRRLTQRGIEDGLKWAPGSVQDILDGGEPRPAEPVGSVPGLPPMTDEERRKVLAATAEEWRTFLAYLDVSRASERGA